MSLNVLSCYKWFKLYFEIFFNNKIHFRGLRNKLGSLVQNNFNKDMPKRQVFCLDFIIFCLVNFIFVA